MSAILPEIEFVDRSISSVRYLEHGWPTDLCRWHAHDEYELHLIAATRGKVFIGDHVGTFEPGCLYLTGPRLPHNWITSESEFDPVEIRDMLIQFNHDGIARAAAAYPEFKELDDLLEESSHGLEFPGFDAGEARRRLAAIGRGTGLERVLQTMEFLLLLSRWPDRIQLSVARIDHRNSVKNNSRIANVIEFIVENHTEQLTLSRFASMAGMSESAFSRCFHSTTGNCFTEFVNRVRIGQACIRLYESNDRIASICHDVGFQNIANFNRQFSKIKGKTPSAFRNEARKGLIS